MDPSLPPEPKEIIDEVYGFIKVYSDGSVERSAAFGGYQPACSEFVQGVATKDVTINVQTGLWVRIFLPECVVSSHKKAPVVLHFHPGALCMGTPSAAVFHAFCSRMAIQSASIWVSVDYRLAPEHRLPTAYNDAYTSFLWLHAQAVMQSSNGNKHSYTDDGSLHVCNSDTCFDVLAFDKHSESDLSAADLHIAANSPDQWMHAHADFSNCFFAGESSGGCIVHYLTMRVVHKEWMQIQIRGLLMIHSAFLIEGFFDSSFDATKERRPGTLRRLCLPHEAEWDHPLLNPLHVKAPGLSDVVMPPLLVAVADQDKLCAPAKRYVAAMEQSGHCIELHLTEGKGHCFYLHDSKSRKSELLQKHLVAFILGHS